jgi:hypothetical protein
VEINVTDIPTGGQINGKRYSTAIYEQLRQLPEGKALEIKGEDLRKVQGVLISNSTRNGMKIRTKVANGCLYVWRREGEATK